ncbi:beta-galactosidase [Salegentibacter agarivorans]|uniref:Beta-galactosidase n=1 Tax=Salegentibacter agarivorans TaxID=345907 RepID=A0A1I2KNE8_9FLAO|nr:beta-galactosidase GalB [Salegentibacter agarivorans]SFF68053.1 beta-galactosidase [Salegentibacter agarivorans]
MKYFLFSKSLCFLVLNFTLICSAQKNSSVNDINFNKDWLFSKGSQPSAEKKDFDDSNWRKLDLPHDWAIEGPFDEKYNARTGGLPVHGIGWYRKNFTIAPKYAGKKIAIEFDGAMNNAKVWLNGVYIGERPFGYIGFEFDLTPHIKFGEENVIAVQLSPEDLASRWYSGAGIYRNVRLKINNPLHIPQWGTFITTPEVSRERAILNIQTTIKNSGDSAGKVTLQTNILDNNGSTVASSTSELSLKSGTEKTDTQEIEIIKPRLWDLDSPNLYKAVSQVKKDGDIIDEYTSSFGIRTISFNSNDGFKLNGKRIPLNGVCMHHDLGPLGAAVNYRATERQMQIMKDMGVNALRTSHNPPSPEMLEVCDKLGIVVIDEAFDEWKEAKVINGYNKYFDEWHEKDLRDMIKRDRNHPSVIMWSIGNEILEQSKKDGWKIAKMLNDICHDEDNTRPTTAGFNYYPAAFKNKLAHQVDVVGMNYKPYNYAEVKQMYPDMIIYGSETSSQTSSRGVYHLPIQADLKEGSKHVSSYDVVVGPPWAYPPEVEFDVQNENPFLLGEFMWTGFDYLGEPTPFGGRDNSTNGYWNDDWPSRSSYFAPVDLAGFPKDRFYLYQSQWTNEPMVHVLPHWNWKGKEGQNIPVFAYTNADEVELFINGKSYGRKIKGINKTEIPAEFKGFEKGMYPSRHRLSWDVPYQSGALKVIAYKDGNKVAEKEIKTASKPTGIHMIADRNNIAADGKDLSFITVRIEDEHGNLHPIADNLVKFQIEGDGVLAAVGNGDQTSMASFQIPERKAFNGLCLLIVKSTEKSGRIKVTASSPGLDPETITVRTE